MIAKIYIEALDEAKKLILNRASEYINPSRQDALYKVADLLENEKNKKEGSQ